jgi:hypothetical protein
MADANFQRQWDEPHIQQPNGRIYIPLCSLLASSCDGVQVKQLHHDQFIYI